MGRGTSVSSRKHISICIYAYILMECFKNAGIEGEGFEQSLVARCGGA